MLGGIEFVVGVARVVDRELGECSVDSPHEGRIVHGEAQGDLDDLDHPMERVPPRLRPAPRTAGRTGTERVRGVEDEEPAALGLREQRVRVRATVLVDGGEVLRVARVADVEDPDPLPAGRVVVGDSDRPARGTGESPVHRGEQDIGLSVPVHVIDGQVVLRPEAPEVLDQHGARAGDVEDAEPVVVADVGLVAPEGDVGVDRARRVRELAEQMGLQLLAELVARLVRRERRICDCDGQECSQ